MQPESEAKMVLLSPELYLMSRVRVPSASARSVIRNKSMREEEDSEYSRDTRSRIAVITISHNIMNS